MYTTEVGHPDTGTYKQQLFISKDSYLIFDHTDMSSNEEKMCTFEDTGH